MLPVIVEENPLRDTDRASRRVRRDIEARIGYFADHPEEIGERLAELDREWCIERIMDINTAAASFAGTFLAIGARRWLVLPAILSGFLLQHAIQGRCAPVSLLRRMGFRTATEIGQERYALKAVRGDFRNLSLPGIRSPQERSRQALRVVRL